MNNKITTAVAALAISLGLAVPAHGAESLDQLLQEVRKARGEISQENKAREQRFRQARAQQAALLEEVRGELAAQEARTEALQQAFNDNELALEDAEENLRIQQGDFGELFGVVRQVAGDAVGTLSTSLTAAQFQDRTEAPRRLADSKRLPSIDDLDALRVSLMQEMIEAGKVVSFPANIVETSGTPADAQVTRVGVFNLVTGDRFLQYDPDTASIKELARQPQARFQAMAGDLTSASPNEIVGMAIDPSRGSLLGLVVQAPSLGERINQGGPVGYVILALGAIGLLIAIYKLIVLSGVGGRIRRQLKASEPNTNNPLGRILAVYHDNQDIDTETLELKLDEAILKEVPPLERWQGAIKVIAAVAPLLGLLGTVTGMIQTFQAITLFGTGDPKLMAGGISQALVTTVLGLVVAIPMVLLHSIVAGRSKALIEVLEEQSAGIIAQQSESGR
jgi:biopolymer transport protein ExbB